MRRHDRQDKNKYNHFLLVYDDGLRIFKSVSYLYMEKKCLHFKIPLTVMLFYLRVRVKCAQIKQKLYINYQIFIFIDS